ncbi:MAG: hypothetical protein U9R25_06310 [Chloroflexota bacterium]|nr:hypothetical protein [Chloroflexota bacterium]
MTSNNHARQLMSTARGDRLLLTGFCLVSYAWRITGLDSQSLWRDEVDVIRFASRSLPEVLETFAKPGQNGPLYFLAFKPWLTLAGQSEFALRYLSLLGSVVAIPLTYFLVRYLVALTSNGRYRFPFGPTLANVPLIAALLMAINPYLSWYAQDAKMYALLVPLMLATSSAFLKALVNGERWRWLIYLFLLIATVLIHVLAFLIVPLHAIWLFLLGRPYSKRWIPFILVLLVPAVPFYLMTGWWQLRLFLMPDFQTGHVYSPFQEMVLTQLSGWSRGVGLLQSQWILLPFVFLCLAGALLATTIQRPAPEKTDGQATQTKAGFRYTAILLTWLALPAIALFLISLRKPLYADRYLIWSLPAFIILVAQGISVVAQLWRPLGWTALVFSLAVGLAAGRQQIDTPIKSDFRAAAGLVQSLRMPEDRVMFLIPYARHTYEYYAGPSPGWVDGLYTNNGNPPEQVDQEMQDALGDATIVWLVASEVEMWDERGLVQAWLETHGENDLTEQFTRVTVNRYHLPISSD